MVGDFSKRPMGVAGELAMFFFNIIYSVIISLAEHLFV